jgi:hypothetical protein
LDGRAWVHYFPTTGYTAGEFIRLAVVKKTIARLINLTILGTEFSMQHRFSELYEYCTRGWPPVYQS